MSSATNTRLELNAMDYSYSLSDFSRYPLFRRALEVCDNSEPLLDQMNVAMIERVRLEKCTIWEEDKFLDFVTLVYKVYMTSLIKIERELNDSSYSFTVGTLGMRIRSLSSSLRGWQEYTRRLKDNATPIPYKCLENLLNSLPRILQALLNHCKRSSELYGSKFHNPNIQLCLTELHDHIGLLIADLIFIMDSFVNYNGQVEKEQNLIRRVLKEISDIAVIADGVDLKTLMNSWKIFAKLAVVHEALVKESSSTDIVTSSYAHIVKHIENFLPVFIQEKQNTNYGRAFKFAGFLLTILGRLCTFYRGYCGKEVCNLLVQLLAKLYRYTPPFPSQRFVVSEHSNFSYYSKTHIVPAASELLYILLEETEFRKAFFLNGKSELDPTISYHLLTLQIIEQLIRTTTINFSPWLQKDDNIVDLALTNVNRCCVDLLVDKIRIPNRNLPIFAGAKDVGIYKMSLKILCHFVLKMSSDNYASLETSLLKHLVSGEFWSALLSCDLWTYLASISSLECRYEYVSYFLKVRKLLRPRANSHEFGITSHLVRRLYKILPNDMKESIFKEIEDPDDKRLLDPLIKSSCQRAATTNESYGLEQTFQDVCRAPSATNWTRLTTKLRSIGAATKEGFPDAVTIRDIWTFLALKIPSSEGIVREMLLELVSLLLDCSALDSMDNSHNDVQAASTYRSMLEIINHLPSEHCLKINVFLRKNLVPRINDSGEASRKAIADLFCRLIDDDDPWVRQEYFETYSEYIVNMASPELFDVLSIGINRLSRVCQQMQLYLSNQKIHNFLKHSSIENYLQNLAVSAGNDPSKWHKCYQSDPSRHDEKRARLESKHLEERIDQICKEIKYITERKNELADSAIDKLRINCLQFFQNDL